MNHIEQREIKLRIHRTKSLCRRAKLAPQRLVELAHRGAITGESEVHWVMIKIILQRRSFAHRIGALVSVNSPSPGNVFQQGRIIGAQAIVKENTESLVIVA